MNRPDFIGTVKKDVWQSLLDISNSVRTENADYILGINSK
jgi:hypothetical protein